MKDYMKRETLAQDSGWTGPWRNIDLCGFGHTKRLNDQKKKQKRRARHNMNQKLRKETFEY